MLSRSQHLGVVCSRSRIGTRQRPWSHAFSRPSDPGIVVLCRLSMNLSPCRLARQKTVRESLLRWRSAFTETKTRRLLAEPSVLSNLAFERVSRPTNHPAYFELATILKPNHTTTHPATHTQHTNRPR